MACLGGPRSQHDLKAVLSGLGRVYASDEDRIEEVTRLRGELDKKVLQLRKEARRYSLGG
jgi:hypothetical protein